MHFIFSVFNPCISYCYALICFRDGKISGAKRQNNANVYKLIYYFMLSIQKIQKTIQIVILSMRYRRLDVHMYNKTCNKKTKNYKHYPNKPNEMTRQNNKKTLQFKLTLNKLTSAKCSAFRSPIRRKWIKRCRIQQDKIIFFFY